jgi:hypothetical protein
MGGLGNQLFQYAFGKAMMHNGIDVAFDISRFPKGHHRFYMLDVFDVNLKFSHFTGPDVIKDSASSYSFSKGYTKLNGKNFFGYWQHLVYFSHLLPELRKEIVLKDACKTEEFKKWKAVIDLDMDSVSVHVRRDDYLTSETIRPLPLVYYYEAIKLVRGNYYIFSDDIEWCKDKFSGDCFNGKINFVSLSYGEDFELMKSCRHHINANSTFSWWASILQGENTVVTPDIWVTKHDPLQRNNYPENWIKLKVNV